MKDNDTKKRALVSDLVHLEWELFRRVNNEGGTDPARHVWHYAFQSAEDLVCCDSGKL